MIISRVSINDSMLSPFVILFYYLLSYLFFFPFFLYIHISLIIYFCSLLFLPNFSLSFPHLPHITLDYRFLLLDLQSSYNRLLSYLNSEVKCQLTSEGSNGIKESLLLDSIQGAELIVIFTLAALSDISSAKSSIMGVSWMEYFSQRDTSFLKTDA